VSILEPRPPATTHRGSCPDSVYAARTRAPRQPATRLRHQNPTARPNRYRPRHRLPMPRRRRLRDLPSGRQPHAAATQCQPSGSVLSAWGAIDRRLFGSSRRVGLEAWRAQIVVRRPRAARSRQGASVHGAHGSGWGCCSPPLPGARWRKAHGFASAAPGGVTSARWSGRRPACSRAERACSAVPPRATMS
jgi:hypothetical protein